MAPNRLASTLYVPSTELDDRGRPKALVCSIAFERLDLLTQMWEGAMPRRMQVLLPPPGLALRRGEVAEIGAASRSSTNRTLVAVLGPVLLASQRPTMCAQQ